MSRIGITSQFFEIARRLLVLSEAQITLATARHLGKLGNAIISLALPGDGSGVIFHANDSSLPSFVPDIIARTKEAKYIVLEAKPKYSISDIQKLEKFKSMAYEKSIKNVLGVGISDVVTALAFAHDNPTQIDFKTGKKHPDLIFVVDLELKCHLILNNCQLPNI